MVHLPIADLTVQPALVVLLGFLIGSLSGFFGVGGGFLLTPLLHAVFGIPYPVAVGSGICQMVGLTTTSTLRHARAGNVDFRLGSITILPAILGAELGARTLGGLRSLGDVAIGGHELDVVTLAMSLTYGVMLIWIGIGVMREARRSLRDPGAREPGATGLLFKLRRLQARPRVSLPASGIASISVWGLLGAGLFVGFLGGFLGVGGGFVLMPVLVYAIGAPTFIAIGTCAYQGFFISVVATVAHALRGNVDLPLALLLLAGSSVGAWFGAGLTRKVDPRRLRAGFALLAFIGAALVAYGLLASMR
jgi:uncharacterized membrane protein YfcA